VSTVEQVRAGDPSAVQAKPAEIRVGLLGLGQVGSAVAAVAAETADRWPPIRIEAALVRDPRSRQRPTAIPLTTCGASIVDSRPDVIVEVLGGLEPARTLVLGALDRGIPVVTANKSLLARHGEQMENAACDAGVPLCYEASVIAGVPFLETFASRPLAGRIRSMTGIVNGTTNYILSALSRGEGDYAGALAGAQRLGFAEPDPSNDVDGVDAAEKLVILLRQFGAGSIDLFDLEVVGITHLTPADFAHASELGGTIKPVVQADWSRGTLHAFSGPAFVPSGHPLAGLEGATNGILLRDCEGREIGLTGPGAGPRATAVTVLDDVRRATEKRPCRPDVRRRVKVDAPDTAWLVRIVSDTYLPDAGRIANLLGRFGVSIARQQPRACAREQWLLTHPAARHRIDAAAAALTATSRASVFFIRALDRPA
jgi:homoserine dehydrogenase